MMRCLFTWVLSAFLCLGAAYALAAGPLGESPNFSRISINPDDSVGEILSITQDHKGFLWFAGRSGLARFDGYRFHTYKAPAQTPKAVGFNSLAAVFEDSFGELWAATYSGIARLNRLDDSFKLYKNEITTQGKSGLHIFKDFLEDDQHRLWAVGPDGIALYDRRRDEFILTLTHSPEITDDIFGLLHLQGDDFLILGATEVYLWNKTTNRIETIKPINNNNQPLPFNWPRRVLKDANGTIWIGHEKGLYKFYLKTKTFEPVALKNNLAEIPHVAITNMFADEKGILWMATDGNGLMYYDTNNQTNGSYTRTVAPSSLGTAVVRSVFQDNVGDLWVSTFPTGLYHYDKTNNYFSYYANFIKTKKDLFANNTWAFLEDSKHNIWLGLDSLGLVYFDRKNNTFSQSFDGFNFAEHKFPNTVLSLLNDSHGNLWMGTWAQGVSRFNPTTKAYKHFNPAQSNDHEFKGLSVWNMIETRTGDIYFGTMNNGIIRYSYTTDTFSHYPNNHDGNKSPNDNAGWSLLEAEDGRIWFGSNRGINIFDPKTQLFTYLENSPDEPTSLSSNSVTWLFKDSKSRIWICTNDGGLNLYHAETNTFSHIGTDEGLKNKDVQSIIEDNNGLLWLTNTNSIISLNPATLERQIYTDKNWLQTGDFNHGAIYKLSSGEILFGGTNGFNILNPHEVTSNTEKPTVFFTELELLNENIVASKPNSVIKNDILNAPKITLTHDDPMFSLRFTTTNYRTHEDNLYTYTLDGFDSEWHKESNNNKATYTHLDAGTYHFWVRAANNNGIWSDKPQSIEIVVLPAPWKTWWAYCTYIAIALGFLLFYILAQQNKLAHEKRLSAKLRELDRLKNEFMTNISHELRTPVNGIVGIAQAIQDGIAGAQNSITLNHIEMILNCGRRLERLVSDVLDFSTSKNSGLKLINSCFDSAAIIADVASECRPSITTDRVTLINTATGAYPKLYGDPERTRRALYNLVANAIKYTEQGKITLSVDILEEFLRISVQDTGIGIAHDHLSKIYESFTQIADSGAHVKNGIGLGLCVAKYFIDTQGGELHVESTPDVGTTFNVLLKRATDEQLSASVETNDSKSAPSPEQKITTTRIIPEPSAEQLIPLVNLLPAYYPQNFHPEISCKRILIVDDEAINRTILRSLGLRNGYIMYEAANGQEAMDALERGLHCDLILLDIMMPKLSGIDTCRLIRKKHTQDQLPIIFISAKNQAKDIEECFNAQGNDFLEKPVNRVELLQRIHKYLSPGTGN